MGQSRTHGARRRLAALALATAACTGWVKSAQAANLYWDSDGATAGGSSSTTAAGTWGVSNFWSTSSLGNAATGAWVAGSTAIFSAGTDVTGTYGVTVSGTQVAAGITIEQGSITFSAGAINLNSGSIIDVTGTSTFSGTVSSAGSVAKAGTGTLVLSGTNNFAGGISVNAGTLSVSSDANLGGSVTLDAATLRPTASFSTSRAFTMGAGGGSFNTGANALTLSGNITGSGALTKTAAGVLVLSGTNSYDGDTFVNNGTLSISADNNLGNPGTIHLGMNSLNAGTLIVTGSFSSARDIIIPSATDSTIDVTTANNFTTAGVISGAGSLSKDGTGTLTLTTANSYSGGTTINTGTLQVGAGGTAGSIVGNVSNSAALIFNRSDTSTYAGVITGSGTVTKSGAGLLQLSSSNSYNGATTLSGGTLQAGAINVLSANSALTMSGGTTLDLNGFANTIGSLSGTGTINLNGGALTFGGDNTSTTFSGIITGAGGLVKNGTGTFQLSSGGPHTGGVTVNDGVLAITSAGSFGASGGITLNGGTLRTLAAQLPMTRLITLGISGGTIDTNGFDSEFNNIINGSGALTKIGAGTLILSNNNAYAGGTTISAGTLQLGAGGAFGTMGGDVTNNAALIFSRSNSITFAGAISGSGSVTQAGSGDLLLTAVSTYGGATAINSGIVRPGINNALPAMTPLTVATSATFDLNGFSNIIGSLAGSGSVALNAGTLDAGQNNSNTTFSGTISGSGNLTKSGSGTLTLGTANSYTGATTISAGVLRNGFINAVPASSAVNVAAGATFNLDGFSNTIGSLAGGGAVTLASASLVTGGDNTTTTFLGSITGTGGLTKNGTGTMAVSGSNTLSGSLRINGGAIHQTTGDNAFGQLSQIGSTVGSNGTYILTGGTFTVNNATVGTNGEAIGFNGTGTFRQTGGTHEVAGANGNLVIGYASTGVGLYDLQSGSLIANSMYLGRDSGGTGTLTQSGGTINIDTEFMDLGLNPGATGIANLTGGTLVAQGIYVGGTSGSSQGTGVLTVNGGAATSNGTLRVWNNAGSSINLAAGSITANALLTSGNPAKFNWTGGLLRITGASGFAISASGPLGSSVNVSAGKSLEVVHTLAISSGSTLSVGGAATVGLLSGTGSVTLDGTMTIGGEAGTATFDGAISGTGTLTRATANTQVVNSISVGAVSLLPGSVTRTAANGTNAGVSKVGSLLLIGSKWDLSNNRLIVSNPNTIGAWNGTGYTGVTAMIAAGRAPDIDGIPHWDGVGLNTSQTTAFANFLTTLAVATASNVLNITGSTTALWGGQTVDADDTLVRYTYAGDANLSGTIDADDYFQLDSHYNKSANIDKSFFNGDFNFDGLYNGDDYFIIDYAYAGQGAPLGAALPAGIAAIPEPAGLALGAICVSLLTRRRRRA